MILLNFQENTPEFGKISYDKKMIQTKNPDEFFSKIKKSNGNIIMNMRCCCSDSDCRNQISFFYSGLNRYASSRNLGSDTEVNIIPSDKKGGEANNVLWNPTKENVAEFVNFSEAVVEAITFKQKLLNGLLAELQVRIQGYEEIQIMVRKENNQIRFILFEIPNIFPNIPLIHEAKEYIECLGVIATLPISTDTSEIKNELANMKNPFFEPIIEWVNQLGKANKLDIEIKNIWVMPE